MLYCRHAEPEINYSSVNSATLAQIDKNLGISSKGVSQSEILAEQLLDLKQK